MKKVVKYIIWFLVALLMLLLLLLLLLQSTPIRKKAANVAIEELNKSLQGTFSIAGVRGNLFNTIIIDSIIISDSTTTVLTVDKIEVNYDLLALLDKQIVVENLILENPTANIHQASKKWNIVSVFKPNTVKEKKESQPFPFSIHGQSILINGLSSDFITKSKVIPEHLDQLNLDAAFSMINGAMFLSLKHLDLQTQKPIYKIDDLRFNAVYDSLGFSVDSLLLNTPKNHIAIGGNYLNLYKHTVSLQSDSINVSEFEMFIPQLYFKTLPKVDINIRTEESKLYLESTLRQLSEEINIEAVFNLDESTHSFIHNSPYDLKLKCKNIHPSNWGIKQNLPIEFNGDIQLKGSGFKFKETPIKYQFNLNAINAYGYDVQQLNAKGVLEYPNVNSEITIVDPKIKAAANIVLTDFIKKQEYSLMVDADYFNGNAFNKKQLDELGGAISIDANGSGFNTNRVNASVNLKSDSLYIKGVTFNSLISDLKINDGVIQVDTFSMGREDVLINSSGYYSFKNKNIEGTYALELDSLNMLYALINDSSINSSLMAEGTVTGATDSLLLNCKYLFKDVVRSTFKLDTLEGEASLIIADSLVANSKFKASGLLLGSTHVDSLKASIAYAKNEIEAHLKAIKTDTLTIEVDSKVLLGDSITIQVPYAFIETPFFDIQSRYQSMAFVIDSSNIKCVDVAFVGTENEKDYELNILGNFNPKGYSDLNLSVDNFRLNILNQIIKERDFQGLVSYNANLIGEGSNPSFTSSLKIDEAQYDWINPNVVNLDFNILNQQAKADLLLLDKANDTLAVDFSFPVSLNFKDSEIGVKDTFDISGNVHSSRVNLSEYTNHNNKGIVLDGDAVLNFTVGGTNVKPLYSGYLSLIDGLFNMEKYGISYHDINASINANNSQFGVDSLIMKSGNGYLRVNGTTEINDSILSGKYGNLDFNLEAKNFHVSNIKAHDIVIDANSQLKSINDSVTYTGKIDVLRSSFFLPDLASSQNSKEQEKPLLVQAIRAQSGDSLFVDERGLRSDTASFSNSDFVVQELFGSLKIIIPKNTWVKSDVLKLEINGDIDVVKTGRFFELFGYIQVSRGSYYLYGRRFNLEGGEINFTGGETFEPSLNLKAEYVFRGADKDVQTLTLNILGTVVEPELSFLIDGRSITESDAISYIIYNRSSDEIGYDNQKGLASAVSSGIMTKMVSSQLSKTLGNQLNLDMIELNTEDNFQSMDFVVGKYITKDLFMKYQRGFGENNNNEITPESVTLEYEVIDNLYFQVQSGSSKTSGIDVTLKFEKENNWDNTSKSRKEKRKEKRNLKK
ncbi:translocation/assembly module TamB domain-containing protein [Saccharicrinis aurantiacus]|uniref:translocation/assembly module TamB domain-containing protein n=1 Tax=Saccharicrinis aurantiacus TaxID=1849719 RepID=UPI0024901240|nr:translocation/assembly module TamB domain-containing protein [Saccharicrinis aurantiacus]